MSRDRYDVVVIGSGFGGAITACRLAEAGRSVCVLERGRRWEPADFPRSPRQVASDAFWDTESGRFGLLDHRAFGGMQVLCASGVGGGSLVYFNVHARPPASVFDDARWPADISLETLDPYYRRVERMLQARPLVPPAGRALPPRTEIFQEACLRTGREAELLRIAVHTGAPDGAQLPCDYSGNCAIGCAAGAKNTLDRTYLPLAERHGAEIRASSQADTIEPRRDCYRVSYRDSAGGDTLWVEAGTVIVAAGTLGSTELLLRCRDVTRSLPRLGRALGSGFSGNGDVLLASALTDRDVDPGRGPSITAGVDVATARQEAYVEDLGFPDPLVWFVEGMLANATPTLNLLRWGKLFLQGTLRIDGATERIGHERARLLGEGRTRGYLPFLGMCEDAADGRLVLDRSGHLDLHWDPRASRRNFAELEDAMRRLSEALGGSYVPSPLGPPLTAHPLGGCPMGAPGEGVVDAFGEVHGHPGLFVVDGSIVPTALARNPSATIGALAERAAFHMIHGRELDAAAEEVTAGA
jgi:cholesterol oxidase